MNLHARYMVLTALVFLIPGLGRALDNILEPFGEWSPSFMQLMFFTLVIGLWLMISDWQHQRPWRPHLVFSVLWTGNMALFAVLPKWSTWNAFSAWAGSLVI